MFVTGHREADSFGERDKALLKACRFRVKAPGGVGESTAADLRLHEREAFCGQRCGVISSAVSRLPQAVVRGRLDRTQNEIGDHCCSLWRPSIASSRDFAAPDQDVELPEDRLLGRVGEPGDADGAVRRLEHAPGRRTMLLHRTLNFPNSLQHTFGRQLIE